jgi:hypothetical protein
MRRSSSARLAALVVWVASVLAPTQPILAAKATPCADGRFRMVQGGQLTVGAETVTVEAVVLQGGRVVLPGACDTPAGKAKAKKTATVVKAKWKACGGLSKVKVSGKIPSPACETMDGKLGAKGQKPAAFSAQRSVCGDGAIDAGAQEQCEGTTGCAAGQHCVATSCQCMADPTTTSTTVSTTTTSSSLPAAICGDGTVQATEACDPLAEPSGCAGGQQCDLLAGACSCGPIPAVIGTEVEFTPPPPPNLPALGLPAFDPRSYHLSANGDGDLLLDPEQSDPLTALGRCAGWITACFEPPLRTLDDCARSAPACTTAEPWLEEAPCCPAACFTAYETLRLAGTSPVRALQKAYYDDGSCFPGLGALLGRP